MGKTWFTADWHIGEKSTSNTHSLLRPRPTEVMVEEWLEHCHEVIKPEDNLVCLGDMIIELDGFKILQRLPKCNHKFLITGDKEWRFNDLALASQAIGYGLFDTVQRSFILPVGDRVYYWAHKPRDCIKDAGSKPALCGHVHGVWRTARMPNGQPIINVGIDAWCGLVSEEMIAHQYDCVTKGYYDENCFPAAWS